MSRFTGVYWRALRWALAAKVALVLVLASPGLLSPTMASAAVPLTAQDGVVLPFILPVSDEVDRTLAVNCLADAVYYEAGFEPEEGQRAIAQVVLNRVRDTNFPDTVCGVVYEGWSRKTGCQFSFVCDGSLKRRPPEQDQIERARAIAEQALSGYVVEEVGTATHYHTDYVSPYWAPTLVKVATVGSHIFYKWKGRAGEAAALHHPYEGGEAKEWAGIRPLRGRV